MPADRRTFNQLKAQVKRMFIYKCILMKLHRINNFKIVNSQQARIIYNYKNTKVKLFKTNEAMVQ
jgi:hypothetical protein